MSKANVRGYRRANTPFKDSYELRARSYMSATVSESTQVSHNSIVSTPSLADHQAVCPGVTDTEMTKNIIHAFRDQGLFWQPPEAVGNIIVAIEAAPSIVGKAYYIEGGDGWEYEDSFVATQPQWLGEEGCRRMRVNSEAVQKVSRLLNPNMLTNSIDLPLGCSSTERIEHMHSMYRALFVSDWLDKSRIAANCVMFGRISGIQAKDINHCCDCTLFLHGLDVSCAIVCCQTSPLSTIEQLKNQE